MVVGVSMAVVPGTYSGTVTSLTYQWANGGVPIAGATSATYTGVIGDVQGVITVTETATGPGGFTSTPSAGVIMAPASAAYATALAAASNGQYFTIAHSAGYKYQIYQRVSGVGVLFDETAVSGAWNSVCAAIDALPAMAVTPLVDFDSIDVAYGEYEFQSRISGAPARTLNLLGGFCYSQTGYTLQNTATLSARTVTDPWGGTNAVEILVATGSAAQSDMFVQTRCPPGTWTFSFWAKISGGNATQTIKAGYNNTGTVQACVLSTSWQQFTQTFNLTAETAIANMFLQGDYPVVATVDYHFAVAGLRLVPGSTAPSTQPDTHPHPALATATNLALNGYELESLTSGAASGNMLSAKQPTQSLTSWTMQSTVNGLISTQNAVIGQLAAIATGTTQNAFQNPTIGKVGPYTSIHGQATRGPDWGNLGRVVWTMTVANSGANTVVSTYLNGLQVHIETIKSVNSGTLANLAACFMHANATAGSGAASLGFVGDVSGTQMWASALTPSQVASVASVALSRASAKGLSITVPRNLSIGNGDSIGYGLLDTISLGFILRASAQDATGTTRTTRVPISLRNISGQTFNTPNSSGNGIVTDELPGTLATAVAAAAAGINPIVTLQIGTNDDQTLTSQAAIDSYWTNGPGFSFNSTTGVVSGSGGVREYLQVLRANGALVIMCSVIPDGRTGPSAVPFDSTATGTIVGGPLSGNSYTSWRKYYNARIAADTSAWDGFCDLAGESHFNGDSWATTNGGNPAAVYGDALHPNAVGNADLQVPAAAALTALLV